MSNNVIIALGKIVKKAYVDVRNYFGYRSGGIVYFERKGAVTDEEVYDYLKKHSRFIDRINPRRMYELSYMAFDAVCGVGFSEPPIAKERDDWTYYEDVISTKPKKATEEDKREIEEYYKKPHKEDS